MDVSSGAGRESDSNFGGNLVFTHSLTITYLKSRGACEQAATGDILDSPPPRAATRLTATTQILATSIVPGKTGDSRRVAGATRASPGADPKARARAWNTGLISRAEFLAGEAITSPGDGFQPNGGNFLVTTFTGPVSAAGAAAQRVVNFLQQLATQTCGHRGHVLLSGSNCKFNDIRRLNVGRQGGGGTFRRGH